MLLAVPPFVVTLDANILYGMPLCDTMLRAAEAGLYHPTWSYEIWGEVLRHLMDPLERERPLSQADADRRLAAAERSFPISFVSDYQHLVATMTNDPKDRHVAAVAVRAHAHVIVTYNLKHFPDASLAPYGVEAQHPDDFLTDLYDLDPDTITAIIRGQAAALRKRPTSPQEVLTRLEQVGITQFARLVSAHFDEGML